ncbi:MAG: GNAT family N-acetyltransferase [Janthinobacterium lividum]
MAFLVERVDVIEAGAHRDAWLDLMRRALEPQVFFDPDFVLTAARHLPKRRRPAFILLWSSEAKTRGDLVGICPVVDRPDPLRALASAWHHDLATLAFPLLDAGHAVAAWRALLAWAAEGLPTARGLVIPSLPADGPTARALRTAAGSDFAIEVLDRWERAVLRPGQGGAGLAALSSKGAKELRRQRRRLSDLGTLAFVSVGEGDALRDGVERFLALEAAGWKGAAGTALLDHPGPTVFARTATRLLGARSLCRVDALTLDGEPIAMAMILRSGTTDFLWKIAYREDLARFSPGVQLVLDLTEAQLRDGGVAETDSCAIPRHPMIDRLWRDRLSLVDVVVATRRGSSLGFSIAVAAERVARRARDSAKRAVLAWRARRQSTPRPQTSDTAATG